MNNNTFPSFQTYFFRAYLRFLRFLRSGEKISIEKERERFRQLGRLIPIDKEARNTSVGANGILCEWFEPQETASDEVIFYIHGGGYVMGSLEAYRGLLCRVAETTKRKVFATTYQQAPEYPFPTAISNVLSTFEWLLNEVPASKITIMGDSAGGGLAVALLLKRKEEALEMPKNAVLIAPWVDLTLQSPSIQKYAEKDMILDGFRLQKAAEMYAGQYNPENIYISPIFGDFEGFPPVFIQAGTYDILFDDSRRLSEKLKSANVPTELHVWRGMPHVWHIIGDKLPEAQEGLNEIASFLNQT